jgi:hypothetical protein
MSYSVIVSVRLAEDGWLADHVPFDFCVELVRLPYSHFVRDSTSRLVVVRHTLVVHFIIQGFYYFLIKEVELVCCRVKVLRMHVVFEVLIDRA